MANLQVVLFDPVSGCRVVYDMEGEERFGILVKTAVGDLINAVARKTGVNPVVVMSDPERNSRFVFRVEPKGTPK